MEQLAKINGKKIRLPKAKFFEIADLLRLYIFPKGTFLNYRHLDVAKKLTVFLYYLKRRKCHLMPFSIKPLSQSPRHFLRVTISAFKVFNGHRFDLDDSQHIQHSPVNSVQGNTWGLPIITKYLGSKVLRLSKIEEEMKEKVS